MRILKKLGSKNKAEYPSTPADCCKECSPCQPDRDTKMFKVTAILDESKFNKELGKYLFIDPFDGDIKVVDHREVAWTRYDSMYRVTDAIYSGPFCEVTIKRLIIENK